MRRWRWTHRGLLGGCEWRSALAGALLAGLVMPALQAAPTAWRDNANGLAIGGYDPVAYYVDARPRRGELEHEYAWHGVVFRFVNPGNLGAFKRDPDVYAPRFAGYDVVDLSQGLVVEGQPEIWAIRGVELYLFDSEENRERWARNPEAVLARAKAQWQHLAETIPALPGN